MSQSLIFHSHSVRVHVENEQVMFVAKDVCAALNISWTGHTLDSIPEVWKGVVKLTTPRRGGRQSLVTINEPAVYKLAFRSNKPEADVFTNWVASEVLPAIRKTGKYEAAPRNKALSLACHNPLEDAHNMLSDALDLFDRANVEIRENARHSFGLTSGSILWEALQTVNAADHVTRVARGLLRRQIAGNFESQRG